ncbi:UNVERIFIED_CONTAM: hypothetical protein PYX00_006054 [Menopon gallinae]|uniref:ODAD1 central coiled coil region domain-containing protein n=1 Tax=Menopon gallinae TaxID=328185 RepID=A0AAW2HTV6_9NEOP
MSKVMLTEEQLDLLVENELNRNQRAFRIMENDRVAYSEEVKRILFKQKTLIAQLEKEKEELETLVKCAESKAFRKRDEVVQRQLQLQLNEYDYVEYYIKKESQELKELQEKIEKTEKDLMELKNKYQIRDSCLEELKKQARKDENLETRLHVETVKFNKLTTENQLLREEIDHLLQERGKFNTMFQQIMGKLDSGKKVLMDLIEQSTMAYDKREEAFTKLDALRNKARQDLVQHSQEMRELKRRLDHETKLHDFVGAKGAKRINVDLETADNSKRNDREMLELHLQEYKAIIGQIKIFFNENDMDRLVSGLLKVEEDNYNLFSFINELNKEMGVLKEQVCEARGKIEEQTGENKKTVETQEASLTALREELVVRTYEADVAENNLTQCRAIVDRLLEGIQVIFRFLQCDPTPLLSLLGPNTTVTKFNYKLYMNLIEKRVTDINNLVWYLAYSKVAQRAEKLFPGQVSTLREQIMEHPDTILPKIIPSDKVVLSQPCPLCVEQEDISEVDETIARPLLKEEIEESMKEVLFAPETEDKMHNVSACRLPKSRRIMQRRFHS